MIGVICARCTPTLPDLSARFFQHLALAFAVDGSRGPRHEMKPGAVVLAMRAKVPLYLVRAEYQGWRVESSWDKSKFPKPFGRVTLHSQRFPLEDFEGQDIDHIVRAAEERLAALLPDDYQAK